jgi:hypothetical protein
MSHIQYFSLIFLILKHMYRASYRFQNSTTVRQGRREGGRGGNFYRGPDLKRGPKRAKFTSFWVIFQNFTGAPDKIHHSLYGPGFVFRAYILFRSQILLGLVAIGPVYYLDLLDWICTLSVCGRCIKVKSKMLARPYNGEKFLFYGWIISLGSSKGSRSKCYRFSFSYPTNCASFCF